MCAPEARSLKGNAKGLGLKTAVAFVVSVTGIGALLAIPAAIVYNGWPGFLIFGALTLLNYSTALLLSDSWALVEKNYPDQASMYTNHPYSGLAEMSGGSKFRRFVSFVVNLSIFGECFPYLIAASSSLENVVTNLSNGSINVSMCFMMIFLVIVLTPVFWIGTPTNWRFVIWLGGASMLLTFVMVLCLLFLYTPLIDPFFLPWTLYHTLWSPAVYAFAIIAFQFGIHPILLNLQTELKNQNEMRTVLQISFLILFVSCGVIAIVANLYWGKALQANILQNFSNSPLLVVTKAFVAFQFIVTIALTINSLFLSMEACLGVPDVYGFRRVVLRTAVAFSLLLVAESVPHFGVAMGLVGGILLTPLLFIFPSFFYISIKNKIHGTIAKETLAVCIILAMLGLIGFILSVIESANEIMRLSSPCYLALPTEPAATTVPSRDRQLSAWEDIMQWRRSQPNITSS